MRFSVISLLLCLGLLSGAAWAQGGWTDAEPVEQAPAPAPEEPTSDESESAASALDPAEDADPLPVRRPRPTTTAAELEWIDAQIENDPFLQPFDAIGPAPETGEFYDPFKRIRLGSTAIKPHAARYLIQGPGGEVLGQLMLRLTLEQSSQYGAVFRLNQVTSLGFGEQVDVWQSAVSGKPLRVTRSRDFGTASTQAPGVSVKEIERFDAKYLFDRVTVTKTKGGVTLSAPTRLQYACFDVAQLPLLMQLLDYNAKDWPFEALLFDSTALEALTLQAGQPKRVQVLSAEPATRDCWEIPVHWGAQQLTWHIERAAPRRLVKFQFNRLTFTLQDYAELKP